MKTPQTPTSPAHAKKAFILGLFAVAALLAVVIIRRTTHKREVEAATRAMATMTVTIIQPQPGPPETVLSLPGSVQPFYEAPIYARTNGYLKKWYVDIGAEVKAGQVLAEIDAPEIDQQLNQAYAVREQAKANLALAKSTADRWLGLISKNAVAQQDVDEKSGELAARRAALTAAEADVSRLENLQSFKKITAPFDGVVTTRNTDIGNLINAGGASAGQELFRVAQIGTLRVYVHVPEGESGSVAIGTPASIALASAPGSPATGKVVGTAKAIDPQSRTLLVEIQVPNPEGKLLPGSYAEVALHVPSRHPLPILPINALLFRPEGIQVGTVDAQGIVALKTVRLGRNFGTTAEVLENLKNDDRVILNPPDSLVAGTKVRVKGNP